MKKFFRLVSMLAVAGLTLAYTSCTDYSKDIDENSEEIQSLSNELATAKQQIESMKTDISNLQAAKSEVEKAIAALQTSLTTLQSKQDADEKEVAEIKATIENLQKSVTDLNAKVKSIEEAIKALASKQDLEDAKAWVESTFVTLDSMKVVNEALGALEVRLQAAESKITSLEGKYDSELKISEILAKIETAQNAADSALTHSKSVLGKVEALQSALGVYAQDGVLKAKIEALEAKDSELADSLSKKLNASDFKGEFDKAFKDAIEDAVAEDGVVGQAIASKISAAKTELEGKINDLKDYVNTKFDYLYNAVKQLRSLVFVPDLYVDGIEATEYTYARYQQKETKSVYAAVGGLTSVSAFGGLTAYIPNGTIKEYKETTKDNGDELYFDQNPALSVTYKMNPSTANVTEDTPLSFVSSDKEFVSTRSSKKAPQASFIKAENGELTVGLSSKSLEQVLSAAGVNKYCTDNLISIFALQATVKNGNDQDTTVTSDFARLYTSRLSFEHLAYKKYVYDGDACGLYQNKMSETLADAISKVPSVDVLYDGTIDLDEIVTTHIKLDRGVNEKGADSKVVDVNKEYITTFPENEFKVTYKFDLIDYMIGSNLTSESKHVFITEREDGHRILTPCAVTAEGEANVSATGAAAFTSVGRVPVVRVQMFVDGKFVLVGYIKLLICKQIGHIEAEPFGDWTYRWYCESDYNKATWAQMVDKVIKNSGCTKEEFVKTYKLETLGGQAIQYYKVDNTFVRADNLTEDQVKALGLNKVLHEFISYNSYSYKYGTVSEVSERNIGSTTNVLNWTLTSSDMAEIYQLDGNKVQIWVRYYQYNAPSTTTDEGIFVPLTAVVNKPVTSVSKKLSEFWFNNGNSAKINVEVPKTVQKLTGTWETELDQLWEGNNPFAFEDAYKKNPTGSAITYSHKYFFAPVQFAATINGNYYEFYVDNANIIDKNLKMKDDNGNIVEKAFKVTDNVQINDYIQKYSANVVAGIFSNVALKCRYISTEDKNAYGDDWRNHATNNITIATIDQSNCKLTYSNNTTAKLLLNYYESVYPTYANTDLSANIGSVVYCTDNVAISSTVDPYYFLRPINVKGSVAGAFIDSDDDAAASSIDLFKQLTFTDWRGREFVDSKYTYLWYFGYYGVSQVKVDTKNATTTLNGGIIGVTKLSDKTQYIKLSYSGNDGVKNVSSYAVWDKDAYAGLVNDFGQITYKNSGNNPVVNAFSVRVPVSITYTWGTINTYVDITVKPYGSK